jgi:hypothetical protein
MLRTSKCIAIGLAVSSNVKAEQLCLERVGEGLNQSVKFTLTSSSLFPESRSVCVYEMTGSEDTSNAILSKNFSLISTGCQAVTYEISYSEPYGKSGDGGGDNPEDKSVFYQCTKEGDGFFKNTAKIGSDLDLISYKNKKCIGEADGCSSGSTGESGVTSSEALDSKSVCNTARDATWFGFGYVAGVGSVLVIGGIWYVINERGDGSKVVENSAV